MRKTLKLTTPMWHPDSEEYSGIFFFDSGFSIIQYSIQTRVQQMITQLGASESSAIAWQPETDILRIVLVRVLIWLPSFHHYRILRNPPNPTLEPWRPRSKGSPLGENFPTPSLPAQHFDQSGVGTTARCLFLSWKMFKERSVCGHWQPFDCFMLKNISGCCLPILFTGFALCAHTCSGLCFPIAIGSDASISRTANFFVHSVWKTNCLEQFFWLLSRDHLYYLCGSLSSDPCAT